MKIDWKSKETRYAISAFLTVAAIIIFSRVIDDIDDLLGIVGTVFSKASTILMPFIMGAIMCYILLPIVRFFDKKVLKFLSKRKVLQRTLSVILTYALVLASLVWLFSYLIPILIKNVQDFAKNLPSYFAAGEALFNRVQAEVPLLSLPTVEKAIDDMLTGLSELVETSVAELVKAVPGYVKTLTGVVTDTFVSFITSIYLLLDVDRMKVSAKRMTYSLFSQKNAEKLMLFVHDADRIFGQYIRARLLTSLLVFILTFSGFSFYSVPYATLFALVAGITNIIPFYGPIIGFLIIVPLTLLISPDKALFAGIYITVLQQLEGYIIDPMISADSVDLRPFWVLLVVTVGGVFGIAGMVLAVPIAAFIGTQLSRFTAARVGPKPVEEKKSIFKRRKSK